MKNKKITTIEDLAALVQQGFLTVQKEFSVVHKKLDNLQKEVLEIKADLENIKLGWARWPLGLRFRALKNDLNDLN